MYKISLTILFSFLVTTVYAQHATDTFHLYFDLNVAPINRNTEKKIDLLIYNDKIINGSNIMIIGYADYLGTEKYNKNLSMERAQNVKRYLVKYGINASDIKVCMGEGQVNRAGLTGKDGYPADRRVDIVINNKKTKKKNPAGKPLVSKPKKDSVVRLNSTNMEDITHLKPGSTMLLKNVYFPPNRHYLEPASYETLEKLVEILKDNPGLKISIEGHVCCISQDAPDAIDLDWDSPTLSVNRARAIYDYLVSKGIDASRLKYIGFAKHRPVVVNEVTEADRERNRRVEIRITENSDQ
jgi:outer membrane protein OmpA-like peptidoglycan-associated protein